MKVRYSTFCASVVVVVYVYFHFDACGNVGIEVDVFCMDNKTSLEIAIEKFQRTIRSQRASVLRLSPRKRSRREKTRRREKREMNGRRRPQRDVQESEI